MNELIVAGNINNEEKREEVSFKELKLIEDPLRLDVTEEANELIVNIYNKGNIEISNSLNNHHIPRINKIVKSFEFMGRENQNAFYSSMCDFIEWLEKINNEMFLEELKKQRKIKEDRKKKQEAEEKRKQMELDFFYQINDFKKGFEDKS